MKATWARVRYQNPKLFGPLEKTTIWLWVSRPIELSTSLNIKDDSKWWSCPVTRNRGWSHPWPLTSEMRGSWRGGRETAHDDTEFLHDLQHKILINKKHAFKKIHYQTNSKNLLRTSETNLIHKRKSIFNMSSSIDTARAKAKEVA